MITNKKLLKNYRDIISASNSAKTILTSEIEKVDEKYRKLAEQEKADLVKQVKALEAHIDLYSTLLAEDAPVEQSAKVEEEEPVISDTIFPENNEEEAISQQEIDNLKLHDPELAEAVQEYQDKKDEEDLPVSEEVDEVEEEADAKEEDEWPDTVEEW